MSYYYSGSLPNAVYGDYRNPNELGSGAVSDSDAAGGGLARITADSIILDGTIKADGQSAQHGGGSGGGIRIDTVTLSGTGTISAVGGGAFERRRGSGGGGRIAVYYNDMSTFSGTINANAGHTSYIVGGAGTIYLKSPTQEHGDLIIDNAGRTHWKGYHATPLRSIGPGVSESVTYDPVTGQSTLTNSNADWPVPNPVTGALGLVGLRLNPNTGQDQTFEVINNTATTITVNGDMTQVAAGGNSYIGEYTFDTVTVSGQAKLQTDDKIIIADTIRGSNEGGIIAPVEFLKDTVVFDNAQFNINELRSKHFVFTNNTKIGAASLTKLIIDAESINIEAGSGIDVTGKGYQYGRTLGNSTSGTGTGAAGGSYGGKGGHTSGSTCGKTYGDFANPNEFGSGNANNSWSRTYGGGLVRIIVDELTLNGSIKANGQAHDWAPTGGGGGIRLDVGTLSGSGKISADGGSNLSGISSSCRCGTSGGGGRIAVYYDDKSGFAGDITAHGGYALDVTGGAGTVYLKSSS